MFGRTLQNGNPIFAVALATVFVPLGFLNATKSSATVFNYFVSVITPFAVLNWLAILVSHISFRRALKAQAIPLSTLPYTGFLQPYASYYGILISILVLLLNGEFPFQSRFLAILIEFLGYDAFIPHSTPTTFVLKYLGVIIFVINVIWWKLVKGMRRIKALDVDLVTNRSNVDDSGAVNASSDKVRVWDIVLAKLGRT